MLRCSIIAWLVFSRQFLIAGGPGVDERKAVAIEIRDISGCKYSAKGEGHGADQGFLNRDWSARLQPRGARDSVALATSIGEDQHARRKACIQESLQITFDLAAPAFGREALHAKSECRFNDAGQEKVFNSRSLMARNKCLMPMYRLGLPHRDYGCLGGSRLTNRR
jgi:hypothetical protein